VTAKAKSFESVLRNYEALLETLLSIAVCNDCVTCLEVTTKASGMHAELERCDLSFAIAVCTNFYSLSDQLSTALQCRDITATASAPVLDASASACTNGVWPPLRPVSVAQKNKPSIILSSNV